MRPSEELTVRFCFVCFDGANALKQLQTIKKNPSEMNLSFNEDFLSQNLTSLVDGVKRLKTFVQKHTN